MKKTKELFKEKIRALGYTQHTFGTLIGRSEDAIKRWKDDTIPEWAWLIIKLKEESKDYKEFFESQKKINTLMNKYTK